MSSIVKLLWAVSTLCEAVPLGQSLLSTPSSSDGRPSIYNSAVMARRIMHLSSIGTLVTTFPPASDEASVEETRPDSVAGSPIGLMEYFADCEPESGNPTLLAINLASPYKNYASGSKISLHIRWWPIQTKHYPIAEESDDIPTPHTPAALPRFSLHGRLEDIPQDEVRDKSIDKCFLKSHPDSQLWQPGNDIHTSKYVRFVVEQVYWFGGFGDRARILWLPMDVWRNVTMQEIEKVRLPGEE
ncbi:hypothetical protein K470DRAFT_258703 [Piedraia hortae CBS 480.64]|uniref:CREG-like beta-barrel domain-containing protein n=1 Tax=Piedraia hortae CBS 480.64 TaxID=1314780 RepID=A0A6A7BWH3_9PEZI|nr:hypothetical protein K470DRAFT_258703 [Piedraia hortae CBS 480.64]